jgi:hypothetical protein
MSIFSKLMYSAPLSFSSSSLPMSRLGIVRGRGVVRGSAPDRSR